MKTHDKSVVVLCSGFGLGFYIPGMVISEGLRERGIETEVQVFETLLRTDKVAMVERNRTAYHASFRVALASQKVPHDIRESMDERQLECLLDRWLAEGRRHFISLSGHWVPVLDAYRARLGSEPVHADLLYVDADLSLETAKKVGNVRTWVTNEFEHDGVRQSPAVFTRLRQMVRDRGGPLT